MKQHSGPARVYIRAGVPQERAAVYIIRGSWVITRRFMMMIVMRKNYDDVCDEKDMIRQRVKGRGSVTRNFQNPGIVKIG